MFSHQAQGNKWSWSEDALKSGFLVPGQKQLWQLYELSLASMSGGQALTPGASWSHEGLGDSCTPEAWLWALLSAVGPLVFVEVGAPAEAPAAGRAHVGPLTRVCPAVGTEV